MQIELTIGFIGLFTFVRTPDGAVTHALVPATRHGGGGGDHGHAGDHDIPAHAARLYVALAPTPSGRDWLGPSIEFDRAILRIREEGSSPSTPVLPPDLFDVTRLTDRRVRSDAFGPSPDPDLVHARVEVRLGGSMDTDGPAFFSVRRRDGGVIDHDVRRDTRTLWTVSIDSAALRVELVSMEDGAVVDVTPDILAFATGGASAERQILLALCHVPTSELPPNPGRKPRRGERLSHFDACYMLTGAVEDAPIPHFEGGIAGEPTTFALRTFRTGGETSSCPNTTALG